MDCKGVSLPLFDDHLMMPWNDLRKGDCCGRFEAINDGYYCKCCDFFVHKKCGDETTKYMEHPCHSIHTLKLVGGERIKRVSHSCDLCGKRIDMDQCYRCKICDFDVDLYCAKYPPPEFIDISETHHHKLTLLKKRIDFDCKAKCGQAGNGFPYKCHECDLAFHVDCVWNPSEAKHLSEVNHSYHPLHPLKLKTGQPPDYSDGKCRLCGREIDELYYHCPSCNFTLDMHCVLNPPPESMRDSKAHDHQLILLPRLDSFTCNACGLKGDRSPYICVLCGFMIHQECLYLPRLININRHDHRISRTSVIGVINSTCGVCRQKMDWSYGGYYCQSCPDYFVHSRCATRRDVWNGKELDGVPEDTETLQVVIDNTTIQHFSHIEHYLRLHINGFRWEEIKRCRACTYPIGLQSFYSCIDCDFILHQTCAEFPRKIWHVLYNERLTLVTSETNVFECDACYRMSNGFRYQREGKVLDVLCGTISEPFFHPSHPHHPLYYILQDEERECTGCNKLASHVLTCIEEDCWFVLDFKCATLPQVAKHCTDDDHPFSLYYGKKANGKHWCDICGKETNIRTWFYTCKDYQDTLHIDCVVGDFSGLMPTTTIQVLSRSFVVVLNNGVTRPFCRWCKSRCMYPIMLKMLGTSDTYVCSAGCLFNVLDRSG
ncbi:PREDICTED: uncharacterized protein LOC104738316 [Camelina sativa]|uniref:Uncharacterized protein LOC104738316 n=1 Tax=Camelina sativa TaxID=90675 RepID=A0ABM0VIQ6_CAMSA|nr:PREDICTED: uncharacterized protein LOC104738316 [Camelina sativa]